jgi:hypothetical protein
MELSVAPNVAFMIIFSAVALISWLVAVTSLDAGSQVTTNSLLISVFFAVMALVAKLAW